MRPMTDTIRRMYVYPPSGVLLSIYGHNVCPKTLSEDAGLCMYSMAAKREGVACYDAASYHLIEVPLYRIWVSDSE